MLLKERMDAYLSADADAERIHQVRLTCAIAGERHRAVEFIERGISDRQVLAELYDKAFGAKPLCHGRTSCSSRATRRRRQPMASDAISTMDAVAIANLCLAAGQPAMTVELLSAGVTLAEARERVDHAGAVRRMGDLAHAMAPDLEIGDMLERAITAGTPVSEVRSALFDMLAAADESSVISNHRSTGDGVDVKTRTAVAKPMASEEAR